MSRKVSLRHFPEVNETLKRDTAKERFEGLAFTTLQSQQPQATKGINFLQMLGYKPPQEQPRPP